MVIIFVGNLALVNVCINKTEINFIGVLERPCTDESSRSILNKKILKVFCDQFNNNIIYEISRLKKLTVKPIIFYT